MMDRKYTADVIWETGDLAGEVEQVDAEATNLETPREAIERVLREDYDPGWKIQRIRKAKGEFGIYG